jgi:hypothetical protein
MIILINVLFKLISKTYATILTLVAHHVNYVFQTLFIEGICQRYVSATRVVG